jgi:hypothetical protein|tara:strand:- start:121 stop:363 length:243 start_codon:yes stop_codon:yes gene_type:complete
VIHRKYERGDIIRYRTFGTDIRTVLVEATHTDIKKGRPGFDGLTVPGAESVWGYDYQIVEVVGRDDPLDPSLFLGKEVTP